MCPMVQGLCMSRKKRPSGKAASSNIVSVLIRFEINNPASVLPHTQQTKLPFFLQAGGSV